MSSLVSLGPCIGCKKDYHISGIKRHIGGCMALRNILQNATVESMHQEIQQSIPDYVRIGKFPISSHHTDDATSNSDHSPPTMTPAFTIMVSDGPYWMILLVPKVMKLHYLDRFLRMTWLECCCHLSCFIIDDEWYHCPSGMTSNCKGHGGYFDEVDTKVMTDYRVQDVMHVGDIIGYNYDFGTTTNLKVDIFGESQSPSCDEVFVLP